MENRSLRASQGGGPGKILLVDDNGPFLLTAEAILAGQFEVTTCSSAVEALALDFTSFDVVCSDFDMPRMNGLDLLKRVQERSPMVCCLLVTGVDDFYDSADKVSRPPVVFKPIEPDRFLKTVAHLVSLTQMKRATKALVTSQENPRVRGADPPAAGGPGRRGAKS